MNIVLCGMPCCGKSVVGKEISKKYKKIVVDTDREIVARHGKISRIFEQHGEEYFRDVESAVVKEVSGNVNVVISTGGGALMRAENVEALKSSGLIFYIDEPIDELCERAKEDTGRPLLAGDPVGNMKKLYDTRDGVYRAVADHIISAGGKTPTEIADEIMSYVV